MLANAEQGLGQFELPSWWNAFGVVSLGALVFIVLWSDAQHKKDSRQGKRR